MKTIIQDRYLLSNEEVRAAIKSIMTTLRLERWRQGISQRALAEIMGSAQSHMSPMENGEHTPNLTTLIRYAAALDCDLVVSLKPRGE